MRGVAGRRGCGCAIGCSDMGGRRRRRRSEPFCPVSDSVVLRFRIERTLAAESFSSFLGPGKKLVSDGTFAVFVLGKFPVNHQELLHGGLASATACPGLWGPRGPEGCGPAWGLSCVGPGGLISQKFSQQHLLIHKGTIWSPGHFLRST